MDPFPVASRPMTVGRRWRAFFLLDGPPGRNTAMEGLRGYAVVLVFLVHAASCYAAGFRGVDFDQFYGRSLVGLPVGRGAADVALLFLHRSHYGVDLFFLLSGFLVFRILERAGDRFAYLPFLARRVVRVYPAFLISLAAFAWLYTSRLQLMEFRLPVLAGNMLFLNGWPGGKFPSYHPVSWSLFYEVSFYLVAPAFALVLRRARRADPRTHILGLQLLLAAAWLVGTWLPRFPVFFFGAFLGMQTDEQLGRAARALPGRLVLAVYGAVTLGYHLFQTDIAYFASLYGLASSLFFIKACYGRGPLHRLFSAAPLRWLGNISYSFYLCHMFVLIHVNVYVLPKLQGLAGAVTFPAYLGIGFLGSISASVLLFAVGERWYFRRGATSRPIAGSIPGPHLGQGAGAGAEPGGVSPAHRAS